jgi:hypothetical protein
VKACHAAQFFGIRPLHYLPHPRIRPLRRDARNETQGAAAPPAAGEGGETRGGDSKVSQETLAEMIGTTRSRVSFFMNKFRKLGFIEYNGGLSVHSSLLNVVLHD